MAGPGGRPEDMAGPGGRPEDMAGPGGRPEDMAGPGDRPEGIVAATRGVVGISFSLSGERELRPPRRPAGEVHSARATS
jgi:hypothetical protein